MNEEYKKGLRDGYKDGVNECESYMHCWISVKDKFPIEEKRVLLWVIILYPQHKIGFYSDGRFYHDGYLYDEDITKWVTHWMELPEKPEPAIKKKPTIMPKTGGTTLRLVRYPEKPE
jgi:hypothetical protein